MAKFGKMKLVIEFLDGNVWKLNRLFRYIDDSGLEIIVPKGFIFDGASIPKRLWHVVGHPLGEYLPAALIHDFLYSNHLIGRKEADKVFYRAMVACKVPAMKAKMMYAAVRAFGWKNYKED